MLSAVKKEINSDVMHSILRNIKQQRAPLWIVAAWETHTSFSLMENNPGKLRNLLYSSRDDRTTGWRKKQWCWINTLSSYRFATGFVGPCSFFSLTFNLFLHLARSHAGCRLAARSPSSSSPSHCSMRSALSYNLQTKEVLGWPPRRCPSSSLVRHAQAQKTSLILMEPWETRLHSRQCDQILETQSLRQSVPHQPR